MVNFYICKPSKLKKGLITLKQYNIDHFWLQIYQKQAHFIVKKEIEKVKIQDKVKWINYWYYVGVMSDKILYTS